MITILSTRLVPGWDGDITDGKPVSRRGQALKTWPIVPLREGLEATYPTDAHVLPYYMTDEGQPLAQGLRLNKRCLQALRANGGEVLFSSIWLDIDGPKGGDLEPWWAAQLAALGDLPGEVAEGMGYYRTRGGYRLVWELEPVTAEPYEELVKGLRLEVLKHGIDADPLDDWTRLYRLPKVARDGVAQSHQMDMRELGRLVWRPGAAGGVFEGVSKAKAPFSLPEQLTDGRINITLFRYACQMRNRGLGEGAILAELESTYLERAPAGHALAPDELETLARQAAQYDVPQDSPPKGGENLKLGSDVELAAVVLQELGSQVVYDQGELWRYSDGLYGVLSGYQVRNRAAALDGSWVYKGEGKNGPKYERLKISQRVCERVYMRLCDAVTDVGFFDDAAKGLAFDNGFAVVTADGVHLEPLSEAHRAQYLLPYGYDPEAKCPKWLAFLADVLADADCIKLLQEFVGACLVGIATTLERCLVLYGEGASGKGTTMRVVRALFPAEVVSHVSPQEWKDKKCFALLAGRWLNLVDELPDGDLEHTAIFKQVVSGDPCTAQVVYKPAFTFHPRAGHMFSGNELPGTRDHTSAYWRRFLMLRYSNPKASHERDLELTDKLLEELPGVASWAMAGAVRVLKRGDYTLPDAMIVDLDAWRRDSNQVAVFVDECTEEHSSIKARDWPTASELYSSFAVWAKKAGHQRMSRATFGRRLRVLGVACRTSNGIRYQLELREDAPKSFLS